MPNQIKRLAAYVDRELSRAPSCINNTIGRFRTAFGHLRATVVPRPYVPLDPPPSYESLVAARAPTPPTPPAPAAQIVQSDVAPTVSISPDVDHTVSPLPSHFSLPSSSSTGSPAHPFWNSNPTLSELALEQYSPEVFTGSERQSVFTHGSDVRQSPSLLSEDRMNAYIEPSFDPFHLRPLSEKSPALELRVPNEPYSLYRPPFAAEMENKGQPKNLEHFNHLDEWDSRPTTPKRTQNVLKMVKNDVIYEHHEVAHQLAFNSPDEAVGDHARNLLYLRSFDVPKEFSAFPLVLDHPSVAARSICAFETADPRAQKMAIQGYFGTYGGADVAMDAAQEIEFIRRKNYLVATMSSAQYKEMLVRGTVIQAVSVLMANIPHGKDHASSVARRAIFAIAFKMGTFYHHVALYDVALDESRKLASSCFLIYDNLISKMQAIYPADAPSQNTIDLYNESVN